MAFTDVERRDMAGAGLSRALAGMDYDAFKVFVQTLSQAIKDDISDAFDDIAGNHTDAINNLNDLKEDLFS